MGLIFDQNFSTFSTRRTRFFFKAQSLMKTQPLASHKFSFITCKTCNHTWQHPPKASKRAPESVQAGASCGRRKSATCTALGTRPKNHTIISQLLTAFAHYSWPLFIKTIRIRIKDWQAFIVLFTVLTLHPTPKCETFRFGASNFDRNSRTVVSSSCKSQSRKSSE